ncbi:hypothetical protein GGI17_003915 [Coemansia sp. S146]|nr:hypothetical protein GGI17_003915 [Coemansia sp. S146]
MSLPFANMTDGPIDPNPHAATDTPISQDPREMYLYPICGSKEEALQLAYNFMARTCFKVAECRYITSKDDNDFSFDGENGHAHFKFTVKLLESSKWQLDIRRVFREEDDIVNDSAGSETI